jgi:hypothetical protein
MSDYPAFPQLEGSEEVWVDDLRIDRMVGGGVRGRSFYPGKKKRFTLVHVLDQQERSDLEFFYDNYRMTFFSFTWTRRGNPTEYFVMFDGPPRFNESPQPLTRFEVSLVQQ